MWKFPAKKSLSTCRRRKSPTLIWTRSKGFLRDFDKDLEQTARQNAVDDIRLAARQNGILSDASERAQLELALFLHQAGFEQVEFSSEKGLLHKSMPQF
jgi:hypothetical protein